MNNKYLLIVLSVLITISASVFQKLVGPTHPDWMKTDISGQVYKYKLPRSNAGEFLAPIKIEMPNSSVSAKVHYKHYPVIEGEEYSVINFERNDNELIAELPHQSAAGKLMYYIELITPTESIFEKKDTPIVLRYRDPVPIGVLAPHIFFMFFAMLLSTLSGLSAATGRLDYKIWGRYAIISLIIGGFIFGPIMQKYAFGEFWTGIPFGWDLTDNKTLIALIAWTYAIFKCKTQEENRVFFIFAAITTLAVFLIPHSVLGSELNRESGKVVTGMISLLF
ncbi:MAG: hypothetical protein KAG96_01240 [Ichthyobacteriaceae bacterium]|nr:hypothetical protein [Ichthyobacteriaceae bacterium]